MKELVKVVAKRQFIWSIIINTIYSIAENGKLLIDNKDMKDTRLDLVFVSQEVDLFDLSIRDNLYLGKDMPDVVILQLFTRDKGYI